MSRKVQFVLFVTSIVFVVVSSASAEGQSEPAQPVRFSRLLNKQPELLRFTSISNLGQVSSVPLEQKFQSLFNGQDGSGLVLSTQPNTEQLFQHRFVETTGEDDDSRLITQPQPGQEYVLIHQQIKQQQNEDSRESITSINQKPISGRKPFALLRQSAGNRLNISPVFPSTTLSRNSFNGNSPVTILSEFINSPDESDVTTTSPFGNVNSEDSEGVTTESVQNDEDTPATTFSSVLSEKAKDRMVINVVTSAPRVVFDNTTAVPRTTPILTTTTSTTPPPTSITTSTRRPHEDDENLVVDAFHRNGHFPDFEDSPAHLHTAESAQPARVNVRPANTGKDYEYEYIYYYYDDEDDDNSTAKKTTDSLPKSTLVDLPQAIPDFASEKIGASKAPVNSIEIPAARTPKAFPVAREEITPVLSSVPQPQAVPQESQEEGQVTTVLPEILRTRNPNSLNRPVLIKQSNLHPVSSVDATTERFVPSTTTTTTTTTTTPVPPPSEAPRHRLRNKARTEAPAVNQFTRNQNEDVPEEPSSPRRPFKDNSRRRNPTRRFPVQQPAEAQTQADDQQTLQQQQVVEEAPRLPGRTRFPPRQTTETAVAPELSVTEAAVAPVAVQEVAQSLESPAADAGDFQSERKAKDNFARQKGINDLYALTRLHQLAINTRVPNRVHPKVVGGFVNSAEQTTKYADDATGSSEATTLASSFPSAVSAEQPTTEQVQTTSTTTTTTTTEASPAISHDRFNVGKQKNRFRQRGNRLNSGADAPSTSTTEAASRPPANPNRFGGRRRPFSPTTAATPSDAEVSNAEQPQQQQVRPAQTRQPVRNKFAGRTRPTTTTTESSSDAGAGAAAGAGEQGEGERVQPQRRRPNFQGRRRNQQLQQQPQQATTPSENAEVSQSTAAAAPRGGERRRFNFADPASRSRPNGPGARPLVRGRQTSTTEAAPVAHEEHEEIVSEHVTITEADQAEKPQHQEQAPIVSISSTTSSSVSVSDVIEPKKGSAGVLGRLRNRSKPVATTTTVAPDVTVPERKPSRLNGILNRRKLNGPGAAATSSPVQGTETQEEQSPEHDEAAQQQQQQQQRQGVVVQISSTVTESEEVGEAHPVDGESDHSSTTHASILNRVKSQRKPGSIVKSARKTSQTSSE